MTCISRYLAKDSSDIQRAFGSSKSRRRSPGTKQTCLCGNLFGPKPDPCTPHQHPMIDNALADHVTVTSGPWRVQPGSVQYRYARGCQYSARCQATQGFTILPAPMQTDTHPCRRALSTPTWVNTTQQPAGASRNGKT